MKNIRPTEDDNHRNSIENSDFFHFMNEKQFEIFIIYLSFILFIFFVIAVLIPSVGNGVFLDNHHLPDTLFIFGAAWRTYQGLTPAIDFGYFYGGLLENGMALTMRIFGHSVFIFDYFTVILVLIFSLIIIAMLRSRLSVSGLSLILMIIAALLLTRQPLEHQSVGSNLVSTHSFLYNRFGLVVLIAAGMFVALPSRNRAAELAGGMLAGVLVAFAMQVKPTFAILLVGTVGGLMLQLRWRAVGGLLLAAVIVLMFVDPMLLRWRNALAYAAAQVTEERGAQLDYLAMRAVRVPLAQILASILAVGAIGYVLQAPASRRAAAGVLVVAVAGVGMTVTMGGAPGQLALPIAILVALAAAELAHREQLPLRTPLRFLAVAIALSLAVPHAANLAGVGVLSHQKAHLAVVETGPFRRYLALQPGNSSATLRPEFKMFADGIDQLNRMGDPSGWGVIADKGITFEYATLSRPVPGFPLWQRRTAPEFAADRPLPPEVDVVMLGRTGPSVSLRDILSKKMGNRFRLCRTSEYWDIFVVRGLRVRGCA